MNEKFHNSNEYPRSSTGIYCKPQFISLHFILQILHYLLQLQQDNLLYFKIFRADLVLHFSRWRNIQTTEQSDYWKAVKRLAMQGSVSCLRTNVKNGKLGAIRAVEKGKKGEQVNMIRQGCIQ